MLRLMFSLIVLSCIAGIVYANDTAITSVGGSAVPLRQEHLQVRMVEETVRLDLYKDYYVTSVDFVFANEGKRTTVTMGFPERGVGFDGGPITGTIQKFTTTVDGHTVVAKRTKAVSDRDTYQAYWTKSVTFRKNQEHRIHVQFRSPYGGGIGGTLAAYDFTGGNWRGKVAHSLLQVTEHPGAPTLAVAELDGHVVSPEGSVAKTTAQRDFAWHNWEAEGSFVLSEKTR